MPSEGYSEIPLTGLQLKNVLILLHQELYHVYLALQYSYGKKLMIHIYIYIYIYIYISDGPNIRIRKCEF